jgi:inorganic pyrophosphatase
MTAKTQTPTELAMLLFKAHPWHGVEARASQDGALNAFVEIVPTDVVKYEIDKRSGHLRIDRPQRYSSVCPTLYGFVPQTYCGRLVAERCAARTDTQDLEGDGDPLDICVLTEKAVTHGDFLVRANPIGGLRMIDGRQADDKLIAVLESDLAYGRLRDIGDCPPGILERLKHYFLSYKQLPDEPARTAEIAEVYDRAEALEVVRCSMADYEERFGPPGGRLEALMRSLGGR